MKPPNLLVFVIVGALVTRETASRVIQSPHKSTHHAPAKRTPPLNRVTLKQSTAPPTLTATPSETTPSAPKTVSLPGALPVFVPPLVIPPLSGLIPEISFPPTPAPPIAAPPASPTVLYIFAPLITSAGTLSTALPPQPHPDITVPQPPPHEPTFPPAPCSPAPCSPDSFPPAPFPPAPAPATPALESFASALSVLAPAFATLMSQFGNSSVAATTPPTASFSSFVAGTAATKAVSAGAAAASAAAEEAAAAGAAAGLSAITIAMETAVAAAAAGAIATGVALFAGALGGTDVMTAAGSMVGTVLRTVLRVLREIFKNVVKTPEKEHQDEPISKGEPKRHTFNRDEDENIIIFHENDSADVEENGQMQLAFDRGLQRAEEVIVTMLAREGYSNKQGSYILGLRKKQLHDDLSDFSKWKVLKKNCDWSFCPIQLSRSVWFGNKQFDVFLALDKEKDSYNVPRVDIKVELKDSGDKTEEFGHELSSNVEENVPSWDNWMKERNKAPGRYSQFIEPYNVNYNQNANNFQVDEFFDPEGLSNSQGI